MSKRAFCQQCNKALVACICGSICELKNRYFLHILQDPSEQKKAIGTARILDLSLSKVQLSIGTVFNSTDFDLDNTFLVFPSETANTVADLHTMKKIDDRTQFILLDGSWKKAYKILMSNPFLKKLPTITFNTENKSSNYRLRKSPREDGLSTVEAGYYLLSELENDTEKFTPLLDVFDEMINFQVANIPKDIYQQNYLKNKTGES